MKNERYSELCHVIEDISIEISQESPIQVTRKLTVTPTVFQTLSISKIVKELIKDFDQQNS